MNVLAGGNPLYKILVFFLIIPLIAAIFVLVNVKDMVPPFFDIALAIFAFFVVYALMTKIVMLA